MKRILFLAPLAALALASCSNEDLDETSSKVGESNAITFSSVQKAVTRGSKDDATTLGNNFVVVGYKGSATSAANTSVVFDHYNVNYVENTANSTLSNTQNWEYVGQDQEVKGTAPSAKLAGTDVTAQTIKYWDHSAASYDFLAFSMGKGYTSGGATTYAKPTAVDKANLKTAAYTLTGDANTLSECYISDITTVKEADYSANAVQLNFRHLTSKVRIALYETVPGYVVSGIKFRETITTSHEPATSTNGVLIGTNAFNDNGTLTVYFPTTGTDNASNSDYNKAHVSFTAAASGTSSKKEFGAVYYKNAQEDAIAAGTTYLGQTSSAASYCGGTSSSNPYTTVLPHENDSKVLSIQIDYTLTATDGSGETINVYGAEADVPAAYTAWKSGYAYTYIFKISQNSNGHTGTSIDDKGLTAISFDAVVMSDESNGIQETITSVTTPSITTYGYIAGTNTVSTNANEYASGTDIYATVQDGTSAVAPTNLYTVTIEDGAVQTINEASIANAIKNGGSASPYIVTDANGKKLTVTAATASTVSSVPTSANTSLTVNALKWTAGASGTIYAVEYVKGEEKTYKIVRIQ